MTVRPVRKELEVAVENNNKFFLLNGIEGLQNLARKYGEIFSTHTTPDKKFTSVQVTLPLEIDIEDHYSIPTEVEKEIKGPCEDTQIYIGLHSFDADGNQVDILPGTDEWADVEDHRWGDEPTN